MPIDKHAPPDKVHFEEVADLYGPRARIAEVAHPAEDALHAHDQLLRVDRLAQKVVRVAQRPHRKPRRVLLGQHDNGDVRLLAQPLQKSSPLISGSSSRTINRWGRPLLWMSRSATVPLGT